MIYLLLNGKQAVPKAGTSIKLTTENPYFSSSTSYTYEVELPLSIAQNKKIFGELTRMDVKKQQEEFTARLYVDNITVLIGSAVITSIDQDSVKIQLLGGTAAYNYKSSREKIYIDKLNMGNWAAAMGITMAAATTAILGGYIWKNLLIPGYGSTDIDYQLTDSQQATAEMMCFGREDWPFVAYPVYNTTSGVLCNQYIMRETAEGSGKFRIQLHTQRTSMPAELGEPWLYFAPQPYLWAITQWIAGATGYTLDKDDNVFWADSFLRRIFIVNVATHMAISDCLPHWTLNEFFENLKNAFGVLIIIDEEHKSMAIKSQANYYGATAKTTYLNQIVDEYSVEIDDDTIVDVTANNVGFADHEAEPRKKLSEDILSVAKTDAGYASLDDISGRMPTANESNFPADTIWDCEDGRQYVKFLSEDKRGAILGEVNQFRNRIVNGTDDIDIELKFVPCPMTTDTLHFTQQDGGHTMASLRGTPYVETDNPEIKIFQRPDRGDVVSLGFGTLETGTYSIENMINGEEEAEEESSQEDLVYIALAKATPQNVSTHYRAVQNGINKGPVTVQMPMGFTTEEKLWLIGGAKETVNEPLSLSLSEVKGQTNLYSKTKSGIMINTPVRLCIKFISDRIPDTSDIFVIRNKRYVCEKIEADITTDGLNHQLTGYFRELTL